MINNLLFNAARHVIFTRDFTLKVFVYVLTVIGLAWISFATYHYYTGSHDRFIGAMASSFVFFITALFSEMYRCYQCKKNKVSSSLPFGSLMNAASGPVVGSAYDQLKHIMSNRKFTSYFLIGLSTAAIVYLSYNLTKDRD